MKLVLVLFAAALFSGSAFAQADKSDPQAVARAKEKEATGEERINQEYQERIRHSKTARELEIAREIRDADLAKFQQDVARFRVSNEREIARVRLAIDIALARQRQEGEARIDLAQGKLTPAARLYCTRLNDIPLGELTSAQKTSITTCESLGLL